MKLSLAIILVVFAVCIAGGFLYISRSPVKDKSALPSPPLQITPKTVLDEPTKIPGYSEKTTVFVTLTSAGFSPQTITINPNTRVVWINKSGTDATVNSNPHPSHTDYPPLNLGSFGKNNKLSLIFSVTGSYGYHNHFDASQTGTIVVR